MGAGDECCGLSLPTYIAGFHNEEDVKKMRYRDLGGTGMKVSILSYGASALGSGYREIDQEEGVQVVIESVKSGINLIDVAPWYGHTVAEKVLGKAFTQIPREAFYLTTKVARYLPEPEEMFDFSFDRTLKSIDESLERMGVSYIDVIQIHDPEFAPNLDIVINETLPALQQAKEAGKVRHIGMTGYPLHVQKQLILGAEAKGIKLDTSLVYCHYSFNDTTLLDGSMEDGKSFMDFLESKGMGCINASPIAMGLLTTRGPPVWHPAQFEPHIVEACIEANKYCTEKGMDISKLAMHFVLRNPRIPTTLVTSANKGRMASNIRAVADTLSDEEEVVLAELADKFFPWRADSTKSTWCGHEPAKYWAKLGQILQCQVKYPTYKRAKIEHK